LENKLGNALKVLCMDKGLAALILLEGLKTNQCPLASLAAILIFRAYAQASLSTRSKFYVWIKD
jgi:hypothetical protein